MTGFSHLFTSLLPETGWELPIYASNSTQRATFGKFFPTQFANQRPGYYRPGINETGGAGSCMVWATDRKDDGYFELSKTKKTLLTGALWGDNLPCNVPDGLPSREDVEDRPDIFPQCDDDHPERCVELQSCPERFVNTFRVMAKKTESPSTKLNTKLGFSLSEVEGWSKLNAVQRHECVQLDARQDFACVCDVENFIVVKRLDC